MLALFLYKGKGFQMSFDRGVAHLGGGVKARLMTCNFMALLGPCPVRRGPCEGPCPKA